MSKTKILLLGPCESGKSVLANFLSEAAETQGGIYRPTAGARIVEFETQGVTDARGRSIDAEVELWDVSGDKKYESCWPAVAKDAGGIIFVYNPDQPNHDKELDIWYSYFVEQQNLKDSNCFIFCHKKPSSSINQSVELSPSFSKIPSVMTNLEEEGGPEATRQAFNDFFGSLLTAMSDKRDQDEQDIMDSR